MVCFSTIFHFQVNIHPNSWLFAVHRRIYYPGVTGKHSKDPVMNGSVKWTVIREFEVAQVIGISNLFSNQRCHSFIDFFRFYPLETLCQKNDLLLACISGWNMLNPFLGGESVFPDGPSSCSNLGPTKNPVTMRDPVQDFVEMVNIFVDCLDVEWAWNLETTSC